LPRTPGDGKMDNMLKVKPSKRRVAMIDGKLVDLNNNYVDDARQF
jgi:hypothetical protein